MKIGDCVKVLSGYAFKSELFNSCGDGLPLVRIRDVGKDCSDTFYPGDYAEEYILQNGDILVGMDGDFRISEWKGGKALLNQRVCKIIPDGKKIFSRFMLYNLAIELKKIEEVTPFVTVKHLSVNKIKEIEIPLPSLPVQKKIAAILDAADLYRQQTRTLIEKYDQLAQSLFLEMFGDPVRNEKGWEKLEFNKLCSFKKESIIPQNIITGTKYVGLECIEKETGNILDINEVTEGDLKSNKFTFDEKYILYGKLRPYLNKVALPNFKGICSTDIIPIKPIKGKSNRQFICHIMRGKGFVSFAHERSSGANLPRISPSVIEKYLVINPPLSLQSQFADRIQLIESQKAQAQVALQKSESLFNSLLQKAFKGELISE